MESKIKFADEKVKESLNKLKKEDSNLHRFVIRAFEDIEKNAFCGIQVPKRLIPREYLKKFNVKNVWKYNLPGAWRLLYSVRGSDLLVFSIILEWMDHKTYERKFKY